MPPTTSPAASLMSKSDEFIRNASGIWQAIKALKKATEPLSKVNDSLELANRAMSGDLPAYNAGLDKVRVFIANQKDALADLARKDENYWVDRSGVNSFDRISVFRAKSFIDELTTNFSQLRTLIQQIQPASEATRAVLSNPGTVGIRSALNESSLPALDGIAMGQIVGDWKPFVAC